MIRLSGLTKSVHQSGGGRRTILRDVSLTVPPACLYGLIGPGAAGKSVLLKMITGLMRPDHGAVQVEATTASPTLNELELQEIRKRIGMLFQNNALFDHLTVVDNIAFPLRRLYAPPEDEMRERVAERLGVRLAAGVRGAHAVGPQRRAEEARRRRAGHGRRARPIVLYDEPAAGLDPVTSQKIFDLLRAEQRGSGRHGGDGVERSRPPAHGDRPRGHDVPRRAHLRRDHGGGADRAWSHACGSSCTG